MTEAFRAIFIVIGILFLLPGLTGVYFLCAVLAEYLGNGKTADALEVQTVVSGLAVLTGFIGVNLLLRADIAAPARGARIAKAALFASCAVTALIALILARAYSLSAQALPPAPLIAGAALIALSVLLAPLPLYLYWKKNR
jgi:predicted tellurium resistance membrane protein TerC